MHSKMIAIAATLVIAGGALPGNAAGPDRSAFTQVAQADGGGFQRPVELIGPELGISGEQFAKCFENVNPVMQGDSAPNVPSKDHERANKAILLPCLQALNPAITNELLDEVTAKYRP